MNTEEKTGDQPTKERKIIQISSASSDEYASDLYALCNDGTVHEYRWSENVSKSGWIELHPITKRVQKS
jgi:hypothetical protein